VRVLEDEAEALGVDGAEVVPADAEAARGAEIVMVFGGDGTFLRAAELARYSHAALMGVNLGRVGFLAETEPEAVEETLTAIERCEYSVEKRLAVEVDVFDADGELVGGTWALNEASIEKSERSRVLDVVIAIDGRPLTSFGCDGVLCSTPTGSTAYAFSSGGPVVWPDVEALLLVPSNAHALFARPMVISPDSQVAIEIQLTGPPAVLDCDGRRTAALPPGARVEVTQGATPVRMVRLDGRPFTDRLVRKFDLPIRGWRGAPHRPGSL
jgi:NAD+ kinase